MTTFLTSTVSTIMNSTTAAATGGGIPSDEIWMVATGFIIAFALAFGIGANDVANSFGTSVGAKVLTLIQACILATIFETAGALLVGAKVSDTIRKGLVDVTMYESDPQLLMIGQISALAGACVWLLLATFFRLPVSGTHSTVGAILGFALVAHGAEGIKWLQVGLIVVSWFVSPLLAGGASVLVFFIVKKFILDKENCLEAGLFFIPFIYALTIIINAFSVFYDGSRVLGFHLIPLYGVFILSFGCGIITGVVVRFVVVPWQRKAIEKAVFEEKMKQLKEQQEANNELTETEFEAEADDQEMIELKGMQDIPEEPVESRPRAQSAIVSAGIVRANLGGRPRAESYSYTPAINRPVNLENMAPRFVSRGVQIKIKTTRKEIQDKTEVSMLFSFLQILTAVFGSFAHGGNDVSNAIGPAIALWVISHDRSALQTASTPIWILFYGSFGISVGLWIWGRRVIKTLGEDLTKITPSSGFCIEIASALTVLVASNIGVPISTTHCKVGAVVCTGRFRSRENVDWRVFRNIAFAWIVTLPVSGGISAGTFAGLRRIIQ